MRIYTRVRICQSVFPLGHAAVAYLFYVVYAAATTRRLPARWALVPLALGSQFPDLVDKPLAYVGVLTYGRSLAHSVFSLIVVSGLVWLVTRQFKKRWEATDWREQLRVLFPAAFTVGYVSHLFGDVYRLVLSRQFLEGRFLLYPIYAVPGASADQTPPWIRILDYYQHTANHLEIGLILLAVALFIGVRLWIARSKSRPKMPR